MTIPQEPPPEPEIKDPTLPENRPIDTPVEIPQHDEPDWRAPGSDEPPIRMPQDNPDVETEI